MKKNPFLLRGVLVALTLCLLLTTGCNRNWPKFWEKKQPETPLAMDTLPLYPADEMPPPIRLGGDETASGDGTGAAEGGELSIELVRPENAGEAVTISELQAIYFGYDSKQIQPAQMQRLEQNARWILQNAADRHIIIEGHCDERGTNEYNMSLGQNRAASVRAVLYRLGIDPSQVSVVSYGEERPVDPGHTEEAWAQNRRVQFLVH